MSSEKLKIDSEDPAIHEALVVNNSEGRMDSGHSLGQPGIGQLGIGQPSIGQPGIGQPGIGYA